jgi:uncharacterized protein DUF6471
MPHHHPKTQKEWAERASRHVKSQLKKHDLTYDDLAERLKEHGFTESRASVANKLARGTFPTPFYLAALVAIGCEVVKLEDI